MIARLTGVASEAEVQQVEQFDLPDHGAYYWLFVL
jgi:hypothetical protein